MSRTNVRLTGRIEGEFVLFLIGMRVNRWWKIGQWLRVVLAMAGMQRELASDPGLGFLGAEQWLGRTTLMVSYCRSMEDLMRYATSKTGKHLPAWRSFNQTVGTSGDVGIWHETYRSRPGDYENVYVTCPPSGWRRQERPSKRPARTRVRRAACARGRGGSRRTLDSVYFRISKSLSGAGCDEAEAAADGTGES